MSAAPELSLGPRGTIGDPAVSSRFAPSQCDEPVAEPAAHMIVVSLKPEEERSMTQMVVAMFDAASAADAAVRDLEAAQIPSAVIRRYVNDDPDERITPTGPDGHHGGQPFVSVAVDMIHADAVAGILNQHGPLDVR